MKLRFDLQEAAQTLMRKEKAGKRLLTCMVVPVPNEYSGMNYNAPNDTVTVEIDQAKSVGRYKNLAHCGSPWCCPVCSFRETEADKKEINLAYAAARAKGFTVVMVTYTQRHSQADKLSFLMNVNAEARRLMKSGSRYDGDTWASLKQRYGMLGGIINLETTYGVNAWHPHNHELIFIDPTKAESVNLDDMYEDFSARWQHAVKLFGGDCDREHGVKIITGDAAVAEYIAKFGREPRGKWSLASEMTKSQFKKAQKEGRTPFDLLHDYHVDGDKQAGALFVEFAREFAGKAHIRWSQGLRDLLDMDNFEPEFAETDETKQAQEQPDFKPFVAMPKAAWYQYVISRRGRRIEFLFACEQGENEVIELLEKWQYRDIIYWYKSP